jgi:hypothetical protein
MIINKNINRTLLLIASLVILTVHANDNSKFCSMEAENWRFTEVDYSSAYNDFAVSGCAFTSVIYISPS